MAQRTEQQEADRRAFVRGMLAETVSDISLVTVLLDEGTGRSPIGVSPVVFTIDQRLDQVALSTLDEHGMIKPLGLWSLAKLWDIAAERQQARDDVADEFASTCGCDCHEDGRGDRKFPTWAPETASVPKFTREAIQKFQTEE